MLVLRCGLRHGARRRHRGRRAAYGPQGVRATRRIRPTAGRLCTKGATTRRHARRPRPADHRAGPGRARRRAGARRRGRGDHRHRRGGCGRSSTSTGPDAVALLRVGADEPGGAVPGEQARQGLRAAPTRSSPTPGCAWPARAAGYKLSLGADGPPGSYEDFDHADVFFVIGSNMADCHPILFLRMMERVKAGAKLIVVDPRRSATADKADLFLQIRPGTDLALLNGLLHLLARERPHRRRVHRRRTPRAGRRCRSSSPTTRPPRSPRSPASRRTDIRQAARLDRRGGRVDELLDHGAQPVHPRHLEHQRPDQPASGDRRDLPPRQRTVLAHRPAQRHGRTGDGLHGPGPARSAIGAGRRGPRVRRGAVGAGARARCARTASARAPSRCSSGWPTGRSRPAGSSAPTRSPRSPTAGPSSRAWRPPSSSSPRTCSPTPRPTPTPTSSCPARCGPRPKAS